MLLKEQQISRPGHHQPGGDGEITGSRGHWAWRNRQTSRCMANIGELHGNMAGIWNFKMDFKEMLMKSGEIRAIYTQPVHADAMGIMINMTYVGA